ncbi:hypothetical protein C8Q80DRAFT_1268913 [Daedaleopsis nitida]|nr:hypothetical protein C8Q80DRAFT_1268913 [Daedaleopsis nitida]
MLKASSSDPNAVIPTLMMSHHVAEDQESESANEMWLDDMEIKDEDWEVSEGGSEEAAGSSTAPGAAMDADEVGHQARQPSTLGNCLPPPPLASSPSFTPSLTSNAAPAPALVLSTSTFTSTHIDRHWSVKKQLEVLTVNFHRLHNTYTDKHVRHVSAETHCTPASHKIACLKHIANRKADMTP